MESTEIRQANRLANVSDRLDDLPREQADAVWNAARELYATGLVSFLTAFEQTLPTRQNDDE